MDDADNRGAIERLVAGINAGDTSVMDDVFADDATMEIPQSAELIEGASNRRAVYGAIHAAEDPGPSDPWRRRPVDAGGNLHLRHAGVNGDPGLRVP